MEQDGWQERLTRAIAREIRRHRQERGLSAQKLADRCQDLGFAVPRAVIANLENGHREAISIAELLILAQALEIAPARLVLPLGMVENVEMAPGRMLPTWEAMRWFAADDDVVSLFAHHETLIFDWQSSATESLLGPDGGIIQSSADLQKRVAEQIGFARSVMRDKDLIPPPLPPELAYLDRQERGHGSH